jgi:hypothetical protein
LFSRVKKPDEFNRPRLEPSDREIKRKKGYVSKKVSLAVHNSNVSFNPRKPRKPAPVLSESRVKMFHERSLTCDVFDQNFVKEKFGINVV